MKRILKIFLPFFLIAGAFVLYHSGLTSEVVYADTKGHWAEAKIEKWSDYGVIGGSDGLFRPGDGITRAEMCTIISRVAQLPGPAADEFTDLEPEQWFADVMLRCVAAGVLEGENGLIMPDRTLSRQEGLDMLLKALAVDEGQGLEMLSEHFVGDAAANNFGYYDARGGDETLRELEEGSLDPNKALSRAELVLMLDACQAAGYLNME